MDCENGGYLTPHCKSCEYWLDGSSWDFGCSNLYFKDCPHLKPIEVKESSTKHKYVYNGTVWVFDECADVRWKGETSAVSKAKARANLTYQWKKEHGYALNAKVSLPDRIIMVE